MIAAIQAGGRSSRMGRDKAWLTVGGQPLITRALDAARTVANRLLILIGEATPNPERYMELARQYQAELVFDQRQGCGPLAGIHAALKHAGEAESVLIIACDLPFVTSQFLEVLKTEHSLGGQLITVPVDATGRLQPLVAIYAVECVHQIEDHLERGILRVDRLFDVIATHRVSPSAYRHLESPQNIFRNINTPEDLIEMETEA